MAIIAYDEYKVKLIAMEDTFTNLHKALGIDAARNYNYFFPDTQWNPTGNPDGFGVQFGDEAKSSLAQINGIRRRVIEPLLELKKQLKKNNAEKKSEIAIFIGPEGGFEEEEISITYKTRLFPLGRAEINGGGWVNGMPRDEGTLYKYYSVYATNNKDLFNLKNADEFRRTLDVNVIGAYNVARRVYKHMFDKKWGRIINISSTNGINTYYPMCLEYDASKAALISLTHNLAIEFSPYVNVNAVAPGFIGTTSELDGYDEEFLKSEQEKILVGRYGKPEEVAKLVKFLVSEDANYINNTIIRIDGGQYGSN